MAPHGGAGSHLKGPGPSRKRAEKTVGTPGSAGTAGLAPLAKVAERNLTHCWTPFGLTQTPLAWPPLRLSVDPPSAQCFSDRCANVSFASSGASPSASPLMGNPINREGERVHSKRSSVFMVGIE